MPRLLYAALIALSLIWGGSFYFIKTLLDDFGPWTIAFLRSACGLLVVTFIMIAMRKPFALRSIPWIPVTIMAMVNTAIPWALIGFSETRLASGTASILNATTPIWTILVGISLFRQPSNRNQWLGVSVAFLGLLVLLGVTPGAIASMDPIGFVGMLLAAICYGFGSQLSKRLLVGFSMYQISFGTLLTSVLACGVLGALTEPVVAADLTQWSNLVPIIGLGAFGSGFAYILFYYMVQKGSPEFASMVTYLVPCTALVWGALLLDEVIHWNSVAGLAIILGGVFLASRPVRTKEGDRPHGARIRHR
ncbi:DMT family transporter [Paenibacillus koleovorans]|uniref:DMT family transporter n=1 Tax=Paenibacillus koleovorans TaxID=121608 RepID=UPI000FD796E6|nr:DMT family transporter [Paenibacillus koleovorans]